MERADAASAGSCDEGGVQAPTVGQLAEKGFLENFHRHRRLSSASLTSVDSARRRERGGRSSSSDGEYDSDPELPLGEVQPAALSTENIPPLITRVLGGHRDLV
jgi:hypothetical protein